eukprot:scaffold122745_cov60-Phaeocystis_antarctica.AAC.1
MLGGLAVSPITTGEEVTLAVRDLRGGMLTLPDAVEAQLWETAVEGLLPAVCAQLTLRCQASALLALSPVDAVLSEVSERDYERVWAWAALDGGGALNCMGLSVLLTALLRRAGVAACVMRNGRHAFVVALGRDGGLVQIEATQGIHRAREPPPGPPSPPPVDLPPPMDPPPPP